MRLCEILVTTKQSLEDLLLAFPPTYCSPEFRLPCLESHKSNVIDAITQICSNWPSTEINTLDGIKILTAHGWGLVRAANTEPAISVRIEGNTPEDLQKLEFILLKIVTEQINLAK